MEQVQQVIHTFDEQTKAPDWKISAVIQEGADFRSIIEYLRQGTGNGTFIFDKDSISCKCATDGNFVYNELVIKRLNLPRYSFWSEDGKPVTVLLEMEQWKEALNGVAKKEDMEILKKREESAIYIRPSGAEDDRFSYVSPLLKQQLCVYEVPHYADDREPTCRVVATKFSRMCSTLGKGKGKLLVTQHTRGITFSQKSVGRTSGQVFYFGDDRDSDEDYRSLHSMCVSKEIIKSLSKLGAISRTSVILIYYNPGEALKLVTKASCYGDLSIYIRGCD